MEKIASYNSKQNLMKLLIDEKLTERKNYYSIKTSLLPNNVSVSPKEML